jgi:outer membrane protein assembly factor BamB
MMMMTQMPESAPSGGPEAKSLGDLVFVGFNSRVAALDRYSGEIVWDWKSPEGGGYVSLMLDGDRLIVSVNGYTYCLDPLFGQEVWRNPLKGFGIGVASLASTNSMTPPSTAAAAAAVAARAASGTPTVT